MNDIAALTQLCPPPITRPDPVDWPAVQATLDMPLPDDYKALAATYGPGTFWDFIHIYQPHAPTEWTNIAGPGPAALQIQLAEDAAQGDFPVPYPAQNLYAVGVTDNGEYIFWVTDPRTSPNQWRIALNEARGPEWFTYDGSLTQFLVAVMSGTVTVPMFPRDLQTVTPLFSPY